MNDVPARRSGLTLDQQLALRAQLRDGCKNDSTASSPRGRWNAPASSYDEFADRAAVARG